MDFLVEWSEWAAVAAAAAAAIRPAWVSDESSTDKLFLGLELKETDNDSNGKYRIYGVSWKINFF